jgi:hypothetical protein
MMASIVACGEPIRAQNGAGITLVNSLIQKDIIAITGLDFPNHRDSSVIVAKSDKKWHQR